MASMNENNGELELLAFQYVSGELAVEDIERFESRLADDQSAREAVARVVQIGHAVALAESSKVALTADNQAIVADTADSFVSESGARNVRRWVIAASAIAVAFLAGIGISHWLELSATDSGSNMAVRDNAPTVDAPVAPDRTDATAVRRGKSAATDVVALWSASAAEFAADGDDHSATVGVNGDKEIQELSLDGDDSWLAVEERAADEDEFRVPSWMLAAVSPDDDPDFPDMMSEEN